MQTSRNSSAIPQGRWRSRRGGRPRHSRRAGASDQDAQVRAHAAHGPGPPQGDRPVRRRARQAFQEQHQSRHLPQLADGQHPRDAAIGAGRIAVDVHGRARVVLELHEAARRLHPSLPRRQRGEAASRARRPLGAQINKFARACGLQGAGLPAAGRAQHRQQAARDQQARGLQGPQAARDQQSRLPRDVPRARRQSRRHGPVRALPRAAAGRGRRLRVPAARPRRAAHVRSVEVPVARPPHDRLLHRDDQRQVRGTASQHRSRAGSCRR